MARPPLESRLHYSSNPRHRQAVDTYLAHHGPDARRRKAQEQEQQKRLTTATRYLDLSPEEELLYNIFSAPEEGNRYV